VYDEFYKFSGIPFQLTPDNRFFFDSSCHGRALAHLAYGLTQEEGFIVITGEVGAGKTTLCEQLWSKLDRNSYVLARIVTTRVSGDDLLRLAVANFGIADDGTTDKAALLYRFEHMAHNQRAAGRRCLLVVDEVQNLSLAALEELRMLSNITVDGRASVQTILFGQPQFRATLVNPELEQLRQRVLASYHLGPLTEVETRAYIEHRLKRVGWTDDPRWDDAAFTCLYRSTDGIPRRINTLCSRVLLYGAVEETHTITGTMVETTAQELSQDLGGGLPAPKALGTLSPSVPSGVGNDVLERRIAALEQHFTRRDRVIRRLADLLGAVADR
jgi:putative secretion ATPase (PEP-CTERM system associated)